MTLDKVKSEVLDSRKVKSDRIELQVEFHDSSYIRIRAHYDSFVRTWEGRGFRPEFSLEEFYSYIETCFYLRILRASGKSVGDYSIVMKYVKIPALIYLVLENLGSCELKEYNITLTPEAGNLFTQEGVKKLTKDEMLNLSQKLSYLEDEGHEMAQGLPKDDKGSSNFMAMQLVDNIIMTHDPDSHPVYAFLSSFVKLVNLQELLIPRIQFLSPEEYDVQYFNLIRSRGV